MSGWCAASLAAVASTLEPVTPHGARHTCASYLIAAGVDDMTLQSVIGHSDVQTAKDVYGHLLPNALDDVRQRLDSFLARVHSGSTDAPPPFGPAPITERLPVEPLGDRWKPLRIVERRAPGL